LEQAVMVVVIVHVLGFMYIVLKGRKQLALKISSCFMFLFSIFFKLKMVQLPYVIEVFLPFFLVQWQRERQFLMIPLLRSKN